MRDLGPNHPLELALHNNFVAQKRNREEFLRDELSFRLRMPELDLAYIRTLMPSRMPNGSPIEGAIKERFLKSVKTELCPSISVEAAVTHDAWENNRVLTDRAFRDMQHVIAVPYVDYFVTDDKIIAATLMRVCPRFPFRTATILNRTAFESRFM